MSASCIIAAARTPVVPRWGALRNVPTFELGRAAAVACCRQAGVERHRIEELVAGNALGPGGNPARSIALHAGLSASVAGLTVDRQCASGLDALLIADSLIRSKQASVVLAGGVESYSLRPKCHLATAHGHADEPMDQAPFTPWPDRDPNMHDAAEKLSRQFGIGRSRQEEWAIDSHRKALNAQLHLTDEIASIPEVEVEGDGFARRLDRRLCKRAKRLTATITSATAAVAADAGAFCLVVSEDMANSSASKAMHIVSGATIGNDPEVPGIAAVDASRKAMQIASVRSSQLRVVELMEAYAVQAIACAELLELPPEATNVGGGALARGHPIGASGAVLAVRAYHELAKRGGIGLAAIPSAGGLGTAIVFSG